MSQMKWGAVAEVAVAADVIAGEEKAAGAMAIKWMRKAVAAVAAAVEMATVAVGLLEN